MLRSRDAQRGRRVGYDVAGLLLPIQHVHGNEDDPRAHAGEKEIEELESIREVHAQSVATLQPARSERLRHAIGALVDVAEGVRARRTLRVVALERDDATAADE